MFRARFTSPLLGGRGAAVCGLGSRSASGSVGCSRWKMVATPQCAAPAQTALAFVLRSLWEQFTFTHVVVHLHIHSLVSARATWLRSSLSLPRVRLLALVFLASCAWRGVRVCAPSPPVSLSLLLCVSSASLVRAAHSCIGGSSAPVRASVLSSLLGSTALWRRCFVGFARLLAALKLAFFFFRAAAHDCTAHVVWVLVDALEPVTPCLLFARLRRPRAACLLRPWGGGIPRLCARAVYKAVCRFNDAAARYRCSHGLLNK